MSFARERLVEQQPVDTRDSILSNDFFQLASRFSSQVAEQFLTDSLLGREVLDLIGASGILFRFNIDILGGSAHQERRLSRLLPQLVPSKVYGQPPSQILHSFNSESLEWTELGADDRYPHIFRIDIAAVDKDMIAVVPVVTGGMIITDEFVFNALIESVSPDGFVFNNIISQSNKKINSSRVEVEQLLRCGYSNFRGEIQV